MQMSPDDVNFYEYFLNSSTFLLLQFLLKIYNQIKLKVRTTNQDIYDILLTQDWKHPPDRQRKTWLIQRGKAYPSEPTQFRSLQ